MPITYSGPDGPKDIVPAPLVVLQKNFVRGPNQLITHIEYLITLSGTLLNVGTSLDSPTATSDNGFALEGILGQQKFLRRLFSQDGGRLEITNPNGGGPNNFDCYCMLESFSVDKSVWVNLATYTIVLKTHAIESAEDIDTGLESFSESWDLQENEDSTYNVRHSLNAKGYISYTGGNQNDPLAIASGWISDRMFITDVSGNFSPANPNNLVGSGITFNIANIINPLSGSTSNFWNKVTTQNYNPQDYTASVTENFIYNPTGNAREIWNANVSFEQDNLRRARINIDGTIFGYGDKLSNLILRNTNASGYYWNTVVPNIYMRVSNYVPSGFTVNTQPISKQVGYERPQGIIRYSFNFSANNGTLIPNAIEENITINDIAPNDIFAQIAVPGRTAGPIIQYQFTSSAPERILNVTATLNPDPSPMTTGSLLSAYLSKPNTDQLIAILQPNTGYFYVREDREEYNPIRRQYSRSVAWTMTSSGVTGLPHAPRHLSPF